MKKLSMLVLLALVLVVAAATMSACGTEAPATEGEQEVVENGQEVAGGEQEAEGSAVAGINHILFFESSVLTTTPQDVAGVSGYPLADFVAERMNETPTGDVTICATDGYTVASTADVLLNYAIIMEGEDAPTLVGDGIDPGLMVKNILYIAFANEAIYFVESDFTFDTVIENLELPEDAVYTFKASDGFAWDAADFEDACKTEMKCPATTGSSVNAFFYSMGDTGADLRECVDVTIH